MEIPSVRVLVVGDSGVGKTTLLQALCRHAMGTTMGDESAPAHRWTTGCDIHVMLHRHRDSYSSESDVYVEFVDVGGHTKYAISRSVFYHEVHGIIFVHDLSNAKSYEHLRAWISEISNAQRLKGCVVPNGSDRPDGFASIHNVPKLVLGNKRDQAPSTSLSKRPNPANDLRIDGLETSALPLSIDHHQFAAFLGRVIAFSTQRDNINNYSNAGPEESTDYSASGLAGFFTQGLRQKSSKYGQVAPSEGNNTGWW
ncbi:TPA: hypothetical protein N0F65_007497 [Lagenidium giganteum]|uniref:Uncharacterized protein n=1 Tax=Lagenidium giganteum TaxID=4803 RepID=A0AAV2ZIK0_9STRA|nr:TPA: hypothetical protein N0F65_007497 [Lagenidium giganteum]